MTFFCKNCGGTIVASDTSGQLACDSCGTRQSLAVILADGASSFIRLESDAHIRLLNTYKQALSKMSAATNDGAYLAAAGLFEEIPGVLNADTLAAKCHEKARSLNLERRYDNAVSAMASSDPEKIQTAIHEFEALGEYRDATAKKQECLPLLKNAQHNLQQRLKAEERQRQREEKQKKRDEARRRFKQRMIGFTVLLVIACLVIGYFRIYSASNVEITLSPNEDNYLSEKFNDYVFTYDVEIENNGWLDISAIEGTVTFEYEGDILVDTNISCYNYSSAVVRAKKRSKFTWELTVYSDNTAIELYEADFDDVDVSVEITKITYTNGKTKTY